MRIDNVRDGRNGVIGSWECEPLVYDALRPDHVGRTVIYRDHGRAEAGTITSWRDGIVFARYSRGDTAAGAKASDLLLGVKNSDGELMKTEGAMRGKFPTCQELGIRAVCLSPEECRRLHVCKAKEPDWEAAAKAAKKASEQVLADARVTPEMMRKPMDI